MYRVYWLRKESHIKIFCRTFYLHSVLNHELTLDMLKTYTDKVLRFFFCRCLLMTPEIDWILMEQ